MSIKNITSGTKRIAAIKMNITIRIAWPTPGNQLVEETVMSYPVTSIKNGYVIL